MSLPRCSIIPPHVLQRLLAAEPGMRPAVEFTLRDSTQVRHRREVLATRWPGGHPPAGQGIITSPLQQRAAPTAPATDAVPAGVPAAATPRRSVHDAGHGTSLPGTLVRSEGVDPSGDVSVDEAYDGLGATWQLLADVYDRDSLDGRGLPLVATVHYARDYDNAFWDGRQMVFGDGDGVYFDRFTRSVDVVAHELAHGLTQYTAGLTYVGQPGALNESASDVWGSLVRQWVRGQTVDEADWLIGAELFTDRVQGVALRSMAAPGSAYDDPVLGRDPQPASPAPSWRASGTPRSPTCCRPTVAYGCSSWASTRDCGPRPRRRTSPTPATGSTRRCTGRGSCPGRSTPPPAWTTPSARPCLVEGWGSPTSSAAPPPGPTS